ncbi:MAG: sigma-E factor negative regulatory protein [Candidatus Obscuribacterales bacterium]|nr:sigma-E factor negative regulatory protein [Steroidobacteraceae bacterium]
MTDAIREQLSAFVDGELSPTEATLLLKRVERDPSLSTQLDRYQLIGEALRREGAIGPSQDFAARVAHAVAQEGATGVQPAVGAWRRTMMGRMMMGWSKPIVGGALAASVVAAAMIVYPVVSRNGVDAPLAASAPVTMPDSGYSEVPTIIPAAAVRASQARQQAAEEMNATETPVLRVADGSRLAGYVMAHSEYSSPLGRRNVLTGLLAEEPTPTEETRLPAEPIVIPQR